MTDQPTLSRQEVLDRVLENVGREAINRLGEAIAGERGDWHRVEVRPDDLKLVLAYIEAVRVKGLARL